MKKIIPLLFILSMGYVLTAQAQPEAFKQIHTYLENHNYFKVRELYKREKKNLPITYQQLTEAYLNNAFNRVKQSQENIDYLLHKKNSIADSLKLKLYEVKVDNAIKMYRYEEAQQSLETLLANYKTQLTDKEIEDYTNDLTLWTALDSTPPQQVRLFQSTKLKMKKDVAGLNNLEVVATNDTVDFIFDTGANLSTTSQSVAERLKMKIIPTTIKVGAITGTKVLAQLAVCDTLKLGNIELNNVVFLVLPDSALSFPQINYQIQGILGFPVIEALKEIQITQDGYFIVPEEETSFEEASNMAMDGLTPLIYLNGKHFTFDTGADHTMFYHKFYQENATEIDKNYSPQKISFGGAGGAVEVKGYKIDYTFNLPGHKVNLTNISVLTNKVKDTEKVYGNIGQDLIRQFQKMTLNFNQMFIVFE